MKISEIFQSRQGEGFLTGTPSVFVRVSGCNLACRFCDTPYASVAAEGDFYTITQILDEIQDKKFNARHVVITGGEPMIQSELPALCEEFRLQGKHITIETAGTAFQNVECDLMSISPKMSNSTPSGVNRLRHEARRFQPDIIRQLIRQYEYQIKFVVGEETDISETAQFISQFPELNKSKIMYMPEGVDPDTIHRVESWLIPWTQQHGFGFCSRKQIEWYGNRRGT